MCVFLSDLACVSMSSTRIATRLLDLLMKLALQLLSFINVYFERRKEEEQKEKNERNKTPTTRRTIQHNQTPKHPHPIDRASVGYGGRINYPPPPP